MIWAEATLQTPLRELTVLPQTSLLNSKSPTSNEGERKKRKKKEKKQKRINERKRKRTKGENAKKGKGRKVKKRERASELGKRKLFLGAE